jgi:hypothetical protein
MDDLGGLPAGKLVLGEIGRELKVCVVMVG